MADVDGDLKCSTNDVLKMDYKKHILDALPHVKIDKKREVTKCNGKIRVFAFILATHIVSSRWRDDVIKLLHSLRLLVSVTEVKLINDNPKGWQ